MDKILVEKSATTCISRGLPTVFLVSDSTPRETYSCLIMFYRAVIHAGFFLINK
ncbi:MAG: hypothetical protein LBC68_07395 [Prevotellaceae bacterium]|nr:hypothetical protein [Prevotellaceae bacterium]